ncbi:MAG: ABC transporter permease [Proteobacteria bacterium]|nr:ABC transporter permease [Pseudomonadota bacterium]
MRGGSVLGQLVSACGLLFAVVLFNFVVLHLAPGDVAETLTSATGGATKEILDQVRHLYGLDQPLHVQFLAYLSRLLHGDLGTSAYFNAPVAGLILDRLFPTALLVGTALVLAIVLGAMLGIVAARRPGGIVNSLVSVLSLVGYSAPVFWTGILVLLAFASWLPLFPAQGMVDPRLSGGPIARVIDVLHHLVLPAVTLASVYLAQYSRLARTSMLDALGADYIRTARAKGLGEHTVVYKHALRNAILPIVTVAGVQVSHLLAGAVLVETVFGWPGMGRLAYESILRRDAPLMLGILFCTALLVIVVNMATDLLYRAIDPRIRTQ